MEKISQILPATSRITTVDKDFMPARRPGGPDFGLPEGESTGDRKVANPQELLKKTADSVIPGRPKDHIQAAIVDEISSEFFVKDSKPSVETEPSKEVDTQNRSARLKGEHLDIQA